MKNIHITPTDKPSRLYLGNNGNFVFGMMQTSIQSRNDDFTNQNIYITSHDKKIILTTDQDLIKDGVQAIDDEFLEWFVKNPSCEEVEVKMNQGRYFDYGGNIHITKAYKIIIPKQELKKNWYCAKCDSYDSSESVTFEETHQICNTGVIVKEEPKQEKLWQVAERYSANELSQLGFINGAKWQEQQTIEEVFEWLTTNNYLTDLKETLMEQFKNK